jgi:hypothetical protein
MCHEDCDTFTSGPGLIAVDWYSMSNRSIVSSKGMAYLHMHLRSLRRLGMPVCSLAFVCREALLPQTLRHMCSNNCIRPLGANICWMYEFVVVRMRRPVQAGYVAEYWKRREAPKYGQACSTCRSCTFGRCEFRRDDPSHRSRRDLYA